MKILFIHPGYWPYLAATNRALTNLTQYLASQGHEVNVLCAGPNPKDPDPNAETNRAVHEGVKIHRIQNLNIPKLGISWHSPINILRFTLMAGLWSLFRSYQFDVIVTLDLPLGMGIWGTAAQVLTFGKTRHICWVMDMIPESRFELGLWRTNNPLHRLIDYIHSWPYRYASRCIVLGQCMKERLLRHHVQPEKISVIGMWHYSRDIAPLPFGWSGISEIHQLVGKFIVMYSGHASSLHSMKTIQDVIAGLHDAKHIHFVLVGDSSSLMELKTYAKDNDLQNVTHLSPVEWKDLGSLLGTGHIHLVALKEEMQGLCVPSKLYGILAAGRPAIFIGSPESQAAVDLLTADAGFVFSSHESEKIIEIIQYLYLHPDAYQRLGKNARECFLKNYDYPVRCALWDEALRKISVSNA
jgi:colanic acid biosynthesis glycosyl transferase WcaI